MMLFLLLGLAFRKKRISVTGNNCHGLNYIITIDIGGSCKVT